MVKGNPKNIREKVKGHITRTKTPALKICWYRVTIIILIFIFLTIIGIFINPLSKLISGKFFTQESNLSIIIATKEGKEFIEKYGKENFAEPLNPTLKGSEHQISLWLTVNGSTTIYTERIYFTVIPCYWYKPIKKQEYRIEPQETIEIPLDFTFHRECDLIDDLISGRTDFMVNFYTEVDYKTNNKLKKQKKLKYFHINKKILLKNLTNSS